MKGCWAKSLGVGLLLWAACAKAQNPPPPPTPEVLPPPERIAPAPAAPVPAIGVQVEAPHAASGVPMPPMLLDIWTRATGWVTATDRTLWHDRCWMWLDGPDGCEPGCVGHTYASAEYLLWWYKDSRLQPIVTTGSSTDLFPGALGSASTQVVIGGNIDHEEQSGGRFRLGYWWDDHELLGMETTYFFLGRRTVENNVGSTGLAGSQLLARPFLNPTTLTQQADIAALPGLVAGFMGVSLDTKLWGIEANARSTLWKGNWYRIGALAGFRFMEMSEGLHIFESTLQVPAGNAAGVVDSFGARNRFYGVQAGSIIQVGCGRWGLDLLSKVAIGNVDQFVDINGQTVITTGAGTAITPGGFLAAASNTGHASHDRFAVVPEVGAQLNLQLTDHWKWYIAYSFLYCSEVARPGDQIDLTINPSQLPSATGPGTLTGVARPTLTLHSTDFWAQGISFGMEFVF